MKRNFLKRLFSLKLANMWKYIYYKYIHYIVASLNGVVSYNQDPERIKVMGLVNEIRFENELLIEDIEALHLYFAVKNTSKVDGEIAEVGSYKGGSAKIICEAKGRKALYLFDTFEGLPALSRFDNPKQFHVGQFDESFDNVKEYLKRYKNVYATKGIFPKTSLIIRNKRFSFVHLDLDIYKSTYDALNFFYPRMNRGGIIISHDYVNAPGVNKAVKQFFKDKPEPVIELAGCQCLIVKL